MIVKTSGGKFTPLLVAWKVAGPLQVKCEQSRLALFLKTPHPSPLPKGEGDKSPVLSLAISVRL
jgi:hypothetical protein